MPLRNVPEERLSVTKVKHQSRRLVFSHIFRNNPCTRADIVMQTGLSHGTVKTIVDEFLESGIIEERKDVSAPVGRKPQKVYLMPRARTFGILHVRPGRLEFHKLDLTLEPEQHAPVVLQTPREDYLVHFRNALGKLKGSPTEGLSAVSVVVPGAYDAESDRVVCHLMPELQGLRIGSVVQETARVPVSVGEDVHLAALAESGFPHSAEQPFFYLYAGAGVGGSFVNDGRVLKGATGMAGEIGQIIMSDGRRLEEVVSWPSFLQESGVAAALGEDVAADSQTARDAIIDLLKAGDRRSVGALQEVVARLSEALSSMVCILNPRTVLIGGPYGYLGDVFIGPLRDNLGARLIPEHGDVLQIMPAQCGDRGMVQGAAVAVLENWFDAEYSVGGMP